MKKIFALLIAVALILPLVACGSSGDSNDSANTPMVTTDSPQETNDNGSDYNEDEFIQESQNPSTVSLRDRTFTLVTDFSEGRAWVQYWDDQMAKQITSVIDTDGNLVFSPEHEVDHFSSYCNGYAFYLYTREGSEKTLDDVVTCIVDLDGNITYSSENAVRIALAYGDGQFLVAEHISNFDTNEWRLGSIDERGNTVTEFMSDTIPFFGFYRSEYDSELTPFTSRFSYLGEGIFQWLGGNRLRLYSIQQQKVLGDFNPDWYLLGSFQDGYLIRIGYGTGPMTYAVSPDGSLMEFDKRNYSDKNDVYVSCYNSGVFFYYDAYLDINGNVKISVPQYEGKTFSGGTFNDGYAPLYIRGADGGDYFTIINAQGTELFEPVPGAPAESFSEGYLVVQLESSCAVYDTNGTKVLEVPYSIVGSLAAPTSPYSQWRINSPISHVHDGYFIASKEGSNIPTIFVGIDGSVIGG